MMTQACHLIVNTMDTFNSCSRGLSESKKEKEKKKS